MTAREVLLDGGSPWGFRMNGGADVGHALRISRVNPGSKAAQRGVREGDVITSINGQPTKCLTNGESHVLLRTVGDTLRLGLNQDTSGSPKRRNKEPLKREASGSSSVSTPSTPVPTETAPAAAHEASTPTTPSDHSESTSAGAKVFECGIWNTAKKIKSREKNGENQVKPEGKIQELPEMKTPVDTAPKSSSSKARRLRKLKLKSIKRGEKTAGVDVSPEFKENDPGEKPAEEEEERSVLSEGDADKMDLVIVMDEEDVRRAGGVLSENETYFTESVLSSVEKHEKVLEVTEDNTSKTNKSKTKKKIGKSKGFSLTQIFTTKVDKNKNSNDSNSKIRDDFVSTCSNNLPEDQLIEDNLPEKSVKIIPATIIQAASSIVEDISSENTLINNNKQMENQSNNSVIQTDLPQNILPNVNITNTPILNSSTIFTTVESKTIPSNTTKTEFGVGKLTSSALNISKIVMMSSNETANTIDGQIKKVEENPLNLGLLQGVEISSKKDAVFDKPQLKETNDKGSRPISIFVVPPDNVAEETEAPGVNWESVSDFDMNSQITALDDDVHPETLIHLPSNDLQSSAAVKDGRNGIVQIDEYDLSVQDLSSPLIEPEEEARLRSFLETLNLTKPEEYDDTSSSKSYGDSSSTSISESSPIPPPPSDEIVVYRQMKSHSVAESCYIPPRLQRHLDVITEETSDPSDTEKKNGVRQPWENSEFIRKNNEMDQIPNDWYGSDEEPETTSDEGGIDTSWRDGKKLEDVEGVEVVYLSDDSDDEESVSKTSEDNNCADLRNKHNLPELVVVHAIDQQDVKSVVQIQQPVVQKEKSVAGETKSRKNAMEEIMAILDSTYEINKDLFIKQSSSEKANNLDQVKLRYEDFIESVTRNKIPKIEKGELESKLTEFTNIVEDPMSIYTTKSEPLTILDVFDSGKYESQRIPVEKKLYEHSVDEVPVAQEVLLAMTPPVLSRQGSSSSATSQSTAKYNPGQSPMSSEGEDKSEMESNHKKKSSKKIYNPKSLTNLSIDVVTCLPHGDFFLKKIGFFGGDLIDTDYSEQHKDVIPNGKLTSLPPSGISTRRSSFHELDNIYSYQHCNSNIERETSPPRPVLLTSPPPSSLMSPPPNDDPWVGLPTSTDPKLLVCLSPSQSKDTTMTTPQEATELLELHKKFVERRGYHEGSKRNSICSPKSERSCTPDFSSPDLIRLEPYESKKAQVYTPELLIEAANLLALKEYRQSRFKSGTQSNCFITPEATVVKIDDNVLEKNDGLSDVTSPRPEIAADSGGSNRSAGTSRLLAFLQDSGVRCASSSPNNTVPSEMDRVDKSVGGKIDRVHRYSGSYISEWLTMSENVKSNSDFSRTDVNKNVINLSNSAGDLVSKSDNDLNNENQFERRHFEAEKYKISKQGDIAIIQTPEDGARQQLVRSERPKSMPAVGVPALTPSGGELFREQMYQEYMNKVAERTERRQQKVIKISSRPTSVHSSKVEEEVDKSSQNAPANKLESEFIVKARERMNKLGINLDDDVDEEEIEEKPAEKDLPKHLQEFMELTTTAPQADRTRDTGVWSPGATPEPQRKEFNFSAVKEEVVQEDTEEVPPVWTPKSAHASPTTERKTFRPVNFESPKLSRKTYNQKPSEEAPKPPTDLPLQLDSPSHSHTSSVSSSTQYLSSTRETHTTTQHTSSSTTQESSAGRLVSSHSLPDTSLLPRAQNPTITLLQKAREGQLPRGAHYLDQNSNNTEDKRSSPPAVRPNEVLYSVRREYESESEDKRPKKIVDLGPRKFDGIGPTTKEGIPIVLRSEVQDENQQKWYKRMYDSLHRAERDKEYVTVRYKTRRGRYPYTSPGGYLSEPEPLGGYDSDYASAKYATLDRRRIRNKENDFTTSTMPRSKYNAVKHAVDVYKNQPGRIEDYEPGHSSIADKETKQWWDEVMDIFDGQFEQTQKSSPRTQAPVTSTNKPFMTYALKESGYESDSTLVFKRRDETQQQLSPAEQKLAYKVIQKGGDVPLHGLRKPVPEKPKEPIRGRVSVPHRGSFPPQRRPESPHRYVESEVTIHYRSPVRSEEKEEWSEAELQRRQAEAMRRIYQEERRRKYLQELQDMYSRRHTDNFTPSQKSPIPLNRYDDFVDDLSPGKPRDRTPEPKLVARALYNFIGQTSRELTFRRGDIIYVRRQIDKNWYEGEHNAMIGLFPFNYVEIIPYDGIRTIPKRPTEGQARAKFNFQAQTHLELPLVKGELVLLTRRVDNNWFEGRIGTRKGIFPVSYVEVLVEPGERALSPVRVNTPTKPVASPASHSLHTSNNMSQHHYQPPRPVSYTSLPRQKTADLKQPPVNQTLHIDTQNEPVPYRVLYNYKPQNEDELELIEGETVYVMEKCDDGWYVGSSQRTGYLGTFPGNYVERQV